MALVTSLLKQVRLVSGDVDQDFPYLDDESWMWLLSENSNKVLDTAVEGLELILNQKALNPLREKSGGYEAWDRELAELEKRLENLKQKRRHEKPVPVIIGTKRKSYRAVDRAINVFGKWHKTNGGLFD